MDRPVEEYSGVKLSLPGNCKRSRQKQEEEKRIKKKKKKKQDELDQTPWISGRNHNYIYKYGDGDHMRRRWLCPVIKAKDGIGRLMVFSCSNIVSGGLLIFNLVIKSFLLYKNLVVLIIVVLRNGGELEMRMYRYIMSQTVQLTAADASLTDGIPTLQSN